MYLIKAWEYPVDALLVLWDQKIGVEIYDCAFLLEEHFNRVFFQFDKCRYVYVVDLKRNSYLLLAIPAKKSMLMVFFLPHAYANGVNVPASFTS